MILVCVAAIVVTGVLGPLVGFFLGEWNVNRMYRNRPRFVLLEPKATVWFPPGTTPEQLSEWVSEFRRLTPGPWTEKGESS